MAVSRGVISMKGSRAHSSIREFTAIDLFSGCGGLTLGLKQAGFRVLAAIEMDKKSNEAFSQNHLEVLLKRRNISRIPVWSIRDELSWLPVS